MKTKTTEHLKIKVKRPNGEIETVIKTENVRFLGTNKQAQAKAIKDTREAGRGDVLSFDIIEVQVPMTLEEQRQELMWDVSAAWDRWSYNRERDFDRDIGLLHSADDERAAKAADRKSVV